MEVFLPSGGLIRCHFGTNRQHVAVILVFITSQLLFYCLVLHNITMLWRMLSSLSLTKTAISVLFFCIKRQDIDPRTCPKEPFPPPLSGSVAARLRRGHAILPRCCCCLREQGDDVRIEVEKMENKDADKHITATGIPLLVLRRCARRFCFREPTWQGDVL